MCFLTGFACHGGEAIGPKGSRVFGDVRCLGPNAPNSYTAGTQFDWGGWSYGWGQVVVLLRLIGRTQVWVVGAGGGLGASAGAGFGLPQA